MSSPSGSSQGGKRKRAAVSGTSLDADTMMDPTLQASSRDASAEEGDSTAPESGRHGHRKVDAATAANTSSGGPHPPKRQRANSERTATTDAADLENALDPGEPSDTTEASVDIAERVGRKSRKTQATKDAADEEKEKAMAPPPIGKLTHPVGYKTNDPPVGRAVRVYADGVFDLFHLGHMRQLEQAKKAFPDVYLIVGVTGDEDTHKRKGLTVLSGSERAETVRHCKWVDEVIDNCPWIVTPEFLDQHQLDYVAHDDIPYSADEGDDIYRSIKEQGKFLVTQRTEGVSTTGIITKIVRDYEQYIARQFKRGASRQELNVSWVKKNEMDIKRHVQDLRDSIRTNWSTTGQELSKELRQFWPQSRPQSPSRPSSILLPNGEALTPTSASARSPGPLLIPSGAGNNANDFISGYALGLVGGVRSWMTKSRSTQDGRAPSDDDDSEQSDGRSPRGRVVPKTLTTAPEAS